MKGIILAGGRATRLYPLTLATNKHLLPVYNKPVIYYAIEKLIEGGVDKIMVVTSPEHVGDFVKILGSGHNFKSLNTGRQIQIVYGIQNTPSGIADGLYIAKDYIGTDNCILYLGDNIIEDSLKNEIVNFKSGALVFLKKVNDPERFGVAKINPQGEVTEIVEKPKKPISDLAVIGVYIYDNTVFKKMVNQPKSKRGEYEITYINNKYIAEKSLKAKILKKPWFDIGTFDSLLRASNYKKIKNDK